MSWLQIAKELRSVVEHARQASVVHLASDVLPNMPTDATAYIQSIEDTAAVADQLVQDYINLHTYVSTVDWVMMGHCNVWG